MKTARQAQRDARRLFKACLVNGLIDETRARGVVQRLVDARRPGALPVVSRFQRLVRLDRTAHHAAVDSAAPLPADLRAAFEAGVQRRWGPGIAVSFAADPALLGGVRITVGSDVYDGTVKAELAALEARL
jgi:F-type H+-transporting ATPase subunit delta